MQTQIQDTDDIRSLWQKTQQTQKEIQKREEELDLKIFSEIDEIHEKEKELCKQEYDKLSGTAKSLSENEKAAKKEQSKNAPIFFLIAIGGFVILTILRALLDIPSEFIVYVFIAALSIIAASTVTYIRNKKITDRINEINTNEEFKDYKARIDKISSEIKKEIFYVEIEKYRKEQNEIKTAYQDNDYDGVRRRCVNQLCGNSVYYYFESVNFANRYQILVDGNVIVASSKEKYNVIKLNPGYHSFELRVSDKDKTYMFAWQAGGGTPLFLTTRLLEASPFCKVRDVSFQEFERISKRTILPD